MLGLGKYNYDRFTKELLLRDVLAGRSAGPRPGERAPGFSARTLEGAEIALRDFRDKKNVVLILGSATCPFTAASIAALNRLDREHGGDDVQFLFVYVREAHPGERLPAHRRAADKLRAAERFQAEEGIEMPVLVDGLGGGIHRKYGKLPNPTYLIDRSGRVAFRCLWTRPQAIERALRELRERQWERDVAHAVVLGGEYSDLPPAGTLWRGHRALDRGGRQAARNFRREMGLPLGITVATGRLLRPVVDSPRQTATLLALSGGIAAGGIFLGRYLRSRHPRNTARKRTVPPHVKPPALQPAPSDSQRLAQD